MLATVYDGGPEGMAVHSVMVFQRARWFAAQCMVVFSIIDGQELPHKPKSTCPKVAVGTQSINRLKILPQETICTCADFPFRKTPCLWGSVNFSRDLKHDRMLLCTIQKTWKANEPEKHGKTIKRRRNATLETLQT